MAGDMNGSGGRNHLDQAQDSRTRVMNAATKVFLSRGYHGTGMREIASESGLSPAAIYNHFAGKRELFSAIVAESNGYGKVIDALVAATGDTLEELVLDAAQRTLGAMEEDVDFFRLAVIDAIELKGGEVSAMAVKEFPRGLAFFVRLRRLGGDRLREFEPLVFMRMFLGFLFSQFIVERIILKQGPFGSLSAIMDDCVDLLLRGILK